MQQYVQFHCARRAVWPNCCIRSTTPFTLTPLARLKSQAVRRLAGEASGRSSSQAVGEVAKQPARQPHSRCSPGSMHATKQLDVIIIIIIVIISSSISISIIIISSSMNSFMTIMISWTCYSLLLLVLVRPSGRRPSPFGYCLLLLSFWVFLFVSIAADIHSLKLVQSYLCSNTYCIYIYIYIYTYICVMVWTSYIVVVIIIIIISSSSSIIPSLSTAVARCFSLALMAVLLGLQYYWLSEREEKHYYCYYY